MKRYARLSTLALFLAAMIVMMFVACNEGSDPIIVDADGDTTDGDTGDGDTGDGDTGDGDTGDGDTGDGDTGDGDTGDGDVTDGDGSCEAWEDGCCYTDEDCAVGKCYEGICIVIPTTEATVWYEDSVYDPEEGDKVGDFRQIFNDDDSPMSPDLSCESEFEDVPDAGTVTVDGLIKVFGVEAPCTLVEVNVFAMYDGSGNLNEEYPDDASLAYAAVQEEPDENFECHIKVENVPVGRWLVFKTYDAGNIQFRDTYMWNVYIKPEDKDNGEHYIEISAITNTSWELIPITIGVSNGIQQDRGALSGTIKDCGSRLIKDATIALSVIPTKLGYFNANVADLLPSPGLTSSNSDSTYAGVNQPSGKVRALSLAKIDGETTKIGETELMVFPGAVSIYSMHGPGPMNYGWFVME